MVFDAPTFPVISGVSKKVSKKTFRESSYGNFNVEVPQDWKSTFAPQIIPKRQKDISSIDRKIISMYERGLSTRQISCTIEELYSFEE